MKPLFLLSLVLFFASNLFSQEQMIIEGAITISNSNDSIAEEGTVRYNPNKKDFEGFDGSRWLSLTRHSQWGVQELNSPTANDMIIKNTQSQFDRFGSDVAISENVALIGTANFQTVGSVEFHSYSNGTWNFSQKVVPPVSVVADRFGFSVDLQDSYAIIGSYSAPRNGISTGAAYMYEKDSVGQWSYSEELSIVDSLSSLRLGYSVAIHDSFAIVGAPRWGNDGFAYVYKRSSGSWTYFQTLKQQDPGTGDSFGNSVSIHGNIAVIGFEKDANFSGSAAVFEYKNGTWQNVEVLYASDSSSYDYFGSSVSVYDSIIVVGARRNLDQGAAYIYKQQADSSWLEVKKLIPEDIEEGDNFGNSVSINGNTIVATSQYDAIDHIQSIGSAYVYNFVSDSWIFETKLYYTQGENPNGYFINSDIDGNRIIIGLPYYSGQFSQTGRVMYFEK